MEIQISLPAVKLGIVEADEVQVSLANSELSPLMDTLCDRKRREFTVETLAEAPSLRAVRGMFREWDMDPSKYRPSSEALLRRVVQGKGLSHISNVVDIINMGSIETAWPYGLYDRSKVVPPIAFRHGLPGESYERIGKLTWDVEGRAVLADHQGPFGAPISDSTRTMITESARDVLTVIYTPQNASDDALHSAMQTLCERLEKFAGAKVTRTNICR